MNNILEATKRFFDDLREGKSNLISPEELHKCLERNERIFILDIRGKKDFAEKFIDGSVNCKWSEVYKLIEDDILPKDNKIVVVCYKGQMSCQTVSILRILGYDVFALYGGIDGWLEKNMPVKSTCSNLE